MMLKAPKAEAQYEGYAHKGFGDPKVEIGVPCRCAQQPPVSL
jgi:hypothetical protein